MLEAIRIIFYRTEPTTLQTLTDANLGRRNIIENGGRQLGTTVSTTSKIALVRIDIEPRFKIAATSLYTARCTTLATLTRRVGTRSKVNGETNIFNSGFRTFLSERREGNSYVKRSIDVSRMDSDEVVRVHDQEDTNSGEEKQIANQEGHLSIFEGMIKSRLFFRTASSVLTATRSSGEQKRL